MDKGLLKRKRGIEDVLGGFFFFPFTRRWGKVETKTSGDKKRRQHTRKTHHHTFFQENPHTNYSTLHLC